MEKQLIEFINTLDMTFKEIQQEAGAGISRLTIHQYQYINAVYELGNPTITEIAKKLNITKASVTTGVNKLVDLGYLLKTRSSDDKRVLHVSLTESSGQLIQAKLAALKEYGQFIEASLSETEARQFKKILTKLVNLFKQA
ncbi:MarR family transcriptional regulator [Candidatus Villigracilis saccharophilus]|uniref:MarR family winged helix-turn-helix transcriptional regulator n=1 Tax=Candidatus Villigracilis saccharophilus TaxID=3140684 RepID=UPI0031354CCC|nr:MarR family transcriptional regulator [Anaerolineales bacterium]